MAAEDLEEGLVLLLVVVRAGVLVGLSIVQLSLLRVEFLVRGTGFFFKRKDVLVAEERFEVVSSVFFESSRV